jgi:NADH dehydrogenase
VTEKKTQIVVVGGGAGGLELVRRLGARFGRTRYDIILVDCNRTHIWKPLLHEVATGSLDANLDEVGYGGHGARWGYRFFYGSLAGIDRQARQIITAPILDDKGREVIGEQRIRYDYLVLAVGGVSNDFGIPGVRDHAMFLESRDQADLFRQRLLNACLRVSHHAPNDPEVKVKVTIVGGGATGVELAAELYNAAAALRHYGLEVFDESRMEVTLIEAGPRILPALPKKLSGAAHEELESLGVRVLTHTQVSEIAEGEVVTKDGRRFPTDLPLWAAGVKAPDFLKDIAGLETGPGNRLMVEPSLRTTRDARIFALGDCCFFQEPGADRPIPPRAQAAHQMAATVFTNLCRLVEGRDDLEAFVYRDKGSLVSLSRFSTVGSLMGNLIGGRMAIEGRLARIAYVSLYRMHLMAIHGYLRGLVLILIGHVNQIVRPKLKLH